MEDVLQAYKGVIMTRIAAAEKTVEVDDKTLEQLNEMVKTFGDLSIKNRANELKEEELKVRKEEIRLAEANHLIGTAAETGAKVHTTNMAARLTSGVMQFEKDGNILASSISRTIPGLITGMVKK